jgi:hypothetical protein
MHPIPINITTENFLSEINKFRNKLDKVLPIKDKPLIIQYVGNFANERLRESWQISTCLYISEHSPYKYNKTFFTTMITYNDATEWFYCINCTLEQYKDIHNILEQAQQK